MTTTPPQFDLVVFGATGFVGQLLCHYLLTLEETQSEVRWAIAGRSGSKLHQLLTDLGPKATDLPMLIAEVTDESSLRDLCAQTRVVISTVGPYALYGEPLVKVCAETGTDYCDLTGEVQWIRRMIQTYEQTARASGARILHCCGFDCIPSDLGVDYLQHQAQIQLGQTCQKVKMRVQAARGGISGGTAASGINILKEVAADPELRRELQDPYSLCPASAESQDLYPTWIKSQWDEDFQAWISPFVMAEANTRIVLRSHALKHYAYGQNFYYDEAVLTGAGVGGWIAATGLEIGMNSLILAASTPLIRRVMERWILPAPGQGPSPKTQAAGYYDLRFLGKTQTGQVICTQVTGDRDPGYGSTAKILGQAGLCLCQDHPSGAGGFWTPSTLLGEDLIRRLIDYAGLNFKVLWTQTSGETGPS